MKRRTTSGGNSARAASPTRVATAANPSAPVASAAENPVARAYEWMERAKLPAERTVLDLPLLELECMNVLWQLGEAPVSRIRSILTRRRALAYTTIETLMNRLVKKGIVNRRKEGPVYLYWPECTLEEACEHAVQRLIDHFFFGSRAMLEAYLGGKGAESAMKAAASEPRGRSRWAAVPAAPARRKAAKAEKSKAEVPGAAIETSLL